MAQQFVSCIATKISQRLRSLSVLVSLLCFSIGHDAIDLARSMKASVNAPHSVARQPSVPVSYGTWMYSPESSLARNRAKR